MMTQAAESMKKADTILAPIPRVEYIQKRHSTKRKWEAIERREIVLLIICQKTCRLWLLTRKSARGEKVAL
jgi:hypothetical protein